MPGIYVAAALTVAITAVLGITALNSLTHSNRKYYWWVVAGLPLSLLVNRFVKMPAVTGLAALTGVPLRLAPGSPAWFIFAIWLLAPILEEAIKLLPLVVPVSRVFLNDASQALWVGLSLGIGFGLGEAAYLAYGLAQSPAYNQLPWYMFTGFASERLMVTLGHGLMTSIAVLGIHYGKRKALFGYLTAVGLHALINLGPILLALRLISMTAASVGSYVTILVAFMIVENRARTIRKANPTTPSEIVYLDR